MREMNHAQRADGAGISGFDYSKVTGGVQFVTNEQPSGSLPLTIRLINTKSDGILTITADEVLSEAVPGCDSVEEALANLDDRVDSVADSKVNKTDIVNNLTTNDSTKVLSAAQGYALNLKIENITTKGSWTTITVDSNNTYTIPYDGVLYITCGTSDNNDGYLTYSISTWRTIRLNVFGQLSAYQYIPVAQGDVIAFANKSSNITDILLQYRRM